MVNKIKLIIVKHLISCYVISSNLIKTSITHMKVNAKRNILKRFLATASIAAVIVGYTETTFAQARRSQTGANPV